MSAPSWALFMKNGDCVGHCFINCGWFQDDVRTLRQIIRYTETPECPIDFDSVIAYGVVYSDDLEFELLKAEETEIKSKQISAIKRQQYWDKGNQVIFNRLSVSPRLAPKLIADEICGVQPMSEHTSKIYTLRVDTDVVSC
ncbi:major head protein [Aeromonas phage PX29]|uniref:Uncharacterized protein n=1 Tax=Aeromonas phage PX29 TaxID=926067 RepID=E5DQA3_9CAUD|nr:major head protein [Aeromonas phage PX29]ADQ52889.1 conserved hypothetical protein [Aeromonas phage PX29]QAX98435.1 hypothetical protein ASfcp2_91 [Aeromonas phage AsFcp_2]